MHTRLSFRVWDVESTHQGVCVCVCHKQDGRRNERGVVSETKGGLGKHKLKALNVTAHSIALRHRSLLPILFAAFYNINNLENIPADCFCLSEKEVCDGNFWTSVWKEIRDRLQRKCRPVLRLVGREGTQRTGDISQKEMTPKVDGVWLLSFILRAAQHPTLTGRHVEHHLQKACLDGSSSQQGWRSFGCITTGEEGRTEGRKETRHRWRDSGREADSCLHFCFSFTAHVPERLTAAREDWVIKRSLG